MTTPAKIEYLAKFSLNPMGAPGCLYVSETDDLDPLGDLVWFDRNWVGRYSLDGDYVAIVDEGLRIAGYARTGEWVQIVDYYQATCERLWEPEEPFIEREPDEIIAQTHDAAVTGLGLAALLVDAMAEVNDHRVVPGLDDDLVTLRGNSLLVLHPMKNLESCTAATPPRDIADLFHTAEQLAAEADSAMRRVAQLALGVTSAYDDSLNTERIERIAARVLSNYTDVTSFMFFDGFASRATNDEELFIEICGAICRLIMEHNETLRITGPGGFVSLTTDDDGNLSLEAHDTRTDTLVEAARWSDPVTVVDPGTRALQHIVSCSDGDLRALRYQTIVHFEEDDE